MTTYNPRELPLDDLLLDPNNFRFQGEKGRRDVAEKRFAEDGVQTAALNRLKQDGLTELRSSIIANGFIPVERIVVRSQVVDGERTDKFVVLEGNRRTAALKILKVEHAAGIDLSEELVQTFDQVPVVVLESEDESAYLAIMGIRHVGGIKEWGGHQGAKLVYELRHDHQLSATDVGSRLGLSAQEVNRRYRAYQAMEQMSDSDVYGEDVHSELYPLFHEALVSPKVRTWLGWSDDTYRFEKEEEREAFYSLITPFTDPSGTRRPSKITSYAEVRELKNLLDNEEAVASLLDLEKPFSDAAALVKSADVSKNWMSKVKAAMSALDHMGLREIGRLDATQVGALQELADLITQIVENREQADGSEE